MVRGHKFVLRPPLVPQFHPNTLLRERGFSLGVLIASCTANFNVHQISYWQTRTAAQTRCARNNHTNLNLRYKNSPPAGAPVNKTQPKAPLPQEGFGMKFHPCAAWGRRTTHSLNWNLDGEPQRRGACGRTRAFGSVLH